ncbi:hypothetical protein HUO13_12490 [Saccharopolyspora erythraea]|uniref:hypothetical protein n=1 Tax=Saccharopolyspora erythraea TaxID=1836 RepID=UPI001BABF532|nr:hypothetical protein [Saccharopolyspora erythraea]QUH01520.1 hypothetical protein HUO13_12490 [Saccharopolyspora erythraea]
MPAVSAAAAVVSPPARPYHDDPSITAFYRDLVEPFGETVDEALLRGGANVFHRDLADALVDDEGIGELVADLVIVTHALPDVHPFTAVASHLNMRLGGRATSFAISEQGLAAPFTALRVMSGFQRSGRAECAVLAVLEQTTMPTRHPLVHDNELVDSGALLVFGGADGLRVDAVETTPTADAATERLRELAAKDPDDTLLVVGPWSAWDGLDGSAVHRVAPGGYCTSVWLELARNWRNWQQEHAVVVLADVEPRTGQGHLAVLRSGRQ